MCVCVRVRIGGRIPVRKKKEEGDGPTRQHDGTRPRVLPPPLLPEGETCTRSRRETYNNALKVAGKSGLKTVYGGGRSLIAGGLAYIRVLTHTHTRRPPVSIDLLGCVCARVHTHAHSLVISLAHWGEKFLGLCSRKEGGPSSRRAASLIAIKISKT